MSWRNFPELSRFSANLGRVDWMGMVTLRAILRTASSHRHHARVITVGGDEHDVSGRVLVDLLGGDQVALDVLGELGKNGVRLLESARLQVRLPPYLNQHVASVESERNLPSGRVGSIEDAIKWRGALWQGTM